MKKINYLLVLILVIFSSRLTAQEILSITEKDQDNDTFINRKNADINSQLILKLDKKELLKKLNASGASNGLPSEVETLIEILQGALKKRQEWINGFSEAITAYENGNKSNVEAFNRKMSVIAGEIVSLLDKDQKLKDYFEEVEPPLWNQLTHALNKRINEIELELFNSNEYNDVRVQMGGWLIHNNQSSPLHFEGLDTNPMGEFYEVERWRFIPTEKQLADLEALQELAKTDDLKEANLLEIIRSKYVTIFIDNLKDKLSAGLEEFKKKSEEIVGSLGIGTVKTDIQNIITESKTLIDLIKSKIEFYSNLKNNPSFSLSLLVTTLTKDIGEFNTAQAKVKQLFIKLETDLEAASSALQEAVRNLKPMIKTLITALTQSVLGKDGLGILNGNEIGDLALEFSDKVLPLALKDLPEEPSTDLRYSGFREQGDRIMVKLIITKGDAGTRIVQETKDISLYRILPHIETSVGIIFAHPLSETSIQKEFQMAPYYNLLFKGIFGASKKWKRNSSLPNTILDLSFGLHISSPDFNKDDVPELGVGLVASTLKDYLQFGWAYNIFHGTPYLFFGIRLPVPTINFGSNGNSSVPVNK